MKRSVLEKMTVGELESLAAIVDVDLSGCGGDSAAMVEALVDDSNRTMTVTVAGTDFKIRVSDMRDERVADIQHSGTDSFADVREMMECILGAKQEKKLADMSTDNGKLDVSLYSCIASEICKKVQEKNS